jgi:microcystin-dependent protein
MMSEPFIAEIRIFAGNFAPRGWAFCDGQLLPISQNTALFSLIGTTYGGDGRTTTALPNLQGRAPMHPGRGPGLTERRLGQKGGVETVTLSEAQMPNHNHQWQTSDPGFFATVSDPTNRNLAIAAAGNLYNAGGNNANRHYR